jgi:triacylglycerol esterase/lipase EstA (alpha/beta hydrolase family)
MRLRQGCTFVATIAALAVGGLWAATAAAADSDPYAPLDRPGPALSVPTPQLQAALSCTSGVQGDARNPILLVPGTTLDPGPNYSWNYERAFAALHWPYCTITLPYHAMGDIQTAGEYIVYALRTMAHVAGRKVDVLGYSQGGMVPRWALRFWPDTRSLVNDLVGIDPSNHGTLDSQITCRTQCPPAFWQQATNAHFLAALNSRAETFAGINYTVIYSRTDEVVVPNLDAEGSSSLHTGSGQIANIAVQQICPADTSDHLAMGTYDPVAYALAVDAFAHEGLADPSRVSSSVCTEGVQPGVDPLTFPTDYAGFLAAIGAAAAASPEVSAEPPLDCYVFTACTASRSGASSTTHKRTDKRRRAHRRRRRRRARHRDAPAFTG